MSKIAARAGRHGLAGFLRGAPPALRTTVLTAAAEPVRVAGTAETTWFGKATRHDTPDTAQWRTEVCWPLAPAGPQAN